MAAAAAVLGGRYSPPARPPHHSTAGGLPADGGLALEGPSFSSIHSHGPRLHSTPNAKLVHRVSRGLALPSNSEQQQHQDPETSTTNTSLSLNTSLSAASGSANDPAKEQRAEDTAKSPLPIREYWNNLLLEASDDAGKASPSHVVARKNGKAVTTNAPSTGSSTLVDQESLAEDVQAGPSNLRFQYSQLEQQYERPASAPPASESRRASPLQDHVSRFANSYTTDSNQHESSRGSRESSATPQPSLAAARVHDIFARHVHNAPPIASTSRNSSLAISGDGRPRQRLRDLLTPSERKQTVVAHHHSYSADLPERQSSPSPRRKIKRPISPITNAQRILHASPSRSMTGRQTSWPIHESPQRSLSYANSSVQASLQSPSRGARLATVGRSTSDQSLHARAENEAAAASRLSREWQSVVARSAVSDAESGLEDDGEQLEQIEGGAAEGDDADIEDEEADLSPGLADDIAEEDEQLTDIQEPDFIRGASEEQENYPMQGLTSGASSPRYTTEEDEEEVEPGEETRELGSAKLYLAERRASPHAGGAVTRFSPARLAIPQYSDEAELQSTPGRANLQSSRLRKTPPKTPHLPGFYHSTTPFESTQANLSKRPTANLVTPVPTRHAQGDLSKLESNRSRLFGYPNTPAPPGAYSSPFPHPKQALPLVQQEMDGTGSPVAGSPLKRSPQRAKSTTPRSSPARKRSSPSTKANNVRESPSRGGQITVDSSKNAAVAQAPSNRERTESTESVLQSMMAELVRPLRSLLSSISTSRDAASLTVKEEEEEMDLVEPDAATNVLSERRTRKNEQDMILRRLAEADRLDRSLSTRLEDIRRAVDEMGQNLSSQVSDVLSTSFAQESRKRKGWLLLAILLELFVLWAIFAFADRRAELLHQTTYFDPFYPSLYQRNNFLSRQNDDIPSSFISSFLEPPPVEAHIVPTNWQTAAVQRLWAYKGIASHTLATYSGTSEFVHGTYRQLGQWISSTVVPSERLYRIPT